MTAPRLSHLIGWVLVAVPVAVAVLGPWFAGAAPAKAIPSTPGQGFLFGTDYAGRDVLHLVLIGGRTTLFWSLVATAAMFLLAVPIGLVAALTKNRWLDELCMRPLDIPLAIPSLLLVLSAVSLFPGSVVPLVAAVVAVGVAEVARVTRAAVLSVSGDTVIEALRCGGASWLGVACRYVIPRTAGVLVAAAGLQFTVALSLVATASFLGVGPSPAESDWAAMIEQNRTAMLVQPWPVVLPTLLLAALVVGVNLLTHHVSGVQQHVSDHPHQAGTR